MLGLVSIITVVTGLIWGIWKLLRGSEKRVARLRKGARVAVIGGGSAGCATAFSLSKGTDYLRVAPC
jgi:NADPH-dependent glutamate synthase beta subunit-like oxidoreductase